MRVAFDIGGTFTDVVTLPDDGRLSTTKVVSLLDRVGDDISRCVESQGDENVDRFVHATTICSNAVIENAVVPSGLLTTMGFRDTLELRAQKGPHVPSITWRPPVPLIPRQRCLEVRERILADGTVGTPLDEGSADAAIRQLVASDVGAIAVCFVNSYLNPSHEQRLGELRNFAGRPGHRACRFDHRRASDRPYGFRTQGRYEFVNYRPDVSFITTTPGGSSEARERPSQGA